MTEAIGSGTGAGLLAFLDWTIEKNELNKATGSALKTGAKKVLSVEDDPMAVDLRTLDVENFLVRFTNKTRGEFKDKSQDVYRQRFRQSVGMYLTWLDGGEWRPARLRPTGSVGGNGNGSAAAPRQRTQTPATPTTTAASPPIDTPRSPAPSAGLIEYPFPLRPGLRARLMLPEDLSVAEADRIAAFIHALAFDTPPAADD